MDLGEFKCSEFLLSIEYPDFGDDKTFEVFLNLEGFKAKPQQF